MSLPGALPGPGLCGVCVNRRVVTSGRGSSFFLCRLSQLHGHFPRYPPLPVVRCGGYEAGDPPVGDDQGQGEG